MTSSLNAQVLINSVDVTGHLTSIERSAVLENPGSTVSLVFDSGLSFSGINPWQDLVIYEQGTKTLTGYVTHIIAGRSPAAQVTISGRDTFLRCSSWFISDQIYAGGPDALLSTDLVSRTIDYYVTYFCNLCGISFSINDSAGSTFFLKSDTPIGLQTVSDALTKLSGIAQWCMRVDPSGVLQFDHIVQTVPANYVLPGEINFEEEYNDIDTKDQAKIWGFQNLAGFGGSILFQESRTVPGVPDTRAMVYAIPEVTTVAQAKKVADAALDQWAALEHLGRVNTVGNPSIRVGQTIQFSNAKLNNGTYYDTVTDLRTRLGSGGYDQEITAGRRAYRYPYWPTGGSSPGVLPPNPIGGVLWQTSGSVGTSGFVQDIAINGSDIYLSGRYAVGAGAYHIAVEKRKASDGSLVWHTDLSGEVGQPGDIVFDTNVYVCVGGVSLGTYTSVYRLDAATGGILGGDTIFIIGAGGYPALSQDNSYLYQSKKTDGIAPVTKPGLVPVFNVGYGSGIPTSIDTNANFMIVDAFDNLSLEKYLLQPGGTGLQASFSHSPYFGQEISLSGQKVYLLYRSSGSSGAWGVGRYSVGSMATDAITQDWTVTGPNNYNLYPNSLGAENHAMSAGATKLVIGAGHLYTAFLSLTDGSVQFEDTLSGSLDDSLNTCVQYNGVYYAAGNKGGQWYIQARNCP